MNNNIGTMDKDAPRIMIVDDVESNRYILKNIIQDMGCQPILVENGVQALKMFPRVNPQMILLDIAMPEMDGYEFCKIIKGNPNTRDVPIIFISAFDNTEEIVKGFELGGEDYITKPFIAEVVKARVGVHLRFYNANKNLVELNHRLQRSLHSNVEQMENEKKSVLYALANVARKNALYEDEYIERMQYNACVLAQAMQISPHYEDKISDSYIRTIEVAIPLCDVGNVAVPREILAKESVLTPEEFAVMKTHTTVGAKLLQDINVTGDNNDYIKMAIEIAHFHHENWDGSGYPKGLKGEEIPLAAQIVSLVNSYCALTARRTWREAYDREEAIGIMEKSADIKHNKDMVDICKMIYRQFH